MKYLFPLLACLAVFLAARQFGGALESGIPGASSQKDAGRGTKGLARQAERLAGRTCKSPAALERLHRSGELAEEDLIVAIRQAAAHDPEGVWAWIEAGDYGPHGDGTRSKYLQVVLSKWFGKDPEAALAKMNLHHPNNSYLAGYVIGMLATGTTEEAAAVRDHLDALVDMVGNQERAILFPPRTAEGAAVLMALPEGRSREILLGRFAAAWLETDSGSAAAWVKQLPDIVRNKAMADFTGEALNDRPWISEAGRKFAMEWVMNEASPAEKIRFGPMLAENLAKENPAAAIQWATANLSGDALEDATSKVITRLLSTDPEAAREIAETLSAGDGRTAAVAGVAGTMLKKDPAAAIEWWLDHTGDHNPANRTDARTAAALGSKWFQADPDSFRAYLADPDGRELPFTMVQQALKKMMEDRDGTFDWIASLPPANRVPVIKSAYMVLAQESPEKAAAAFDSRPDLATGDGARMILNYWYGRDPNKAVAWVASLPWGGTREAALSAVRKIAEQQVQKGQEPPQQLKELLH
ncbi:hypothetical protein [Luteolibacter sp. Populi]|uniref:hypothetical protein n=1 Tax=Luteolibacter sp. Populi TaxID=3230487 RepID=UPI0034660A0B